MASDDAAYVTAAGQSNETKRNYTTNLPNRGRRVLQTEMQKDELVRKRCQLPNCLRMRWNLAVKLAGRML